MKQWLKNQVEAPVVNFNRTFWSLPRDQSCVQRSCSLERANRIKSEISVQTVNGWLRTLFFLRECYIVVDEQHEKAKIRANYSCIDPKSLPLGCIRDASSINAAHDTQTQQTGFSKQWF